MTVKHQQRFELKLLPLKFQHAIQFLKTNEFRNTRKDGLHNS